MNEKRWGRWKKVKERGKKEGKGKEENGGKRGEKSRKIVKNQHIEWAGIRPVLSPDLPRRSST